MTPYSTRVPFEEFRCAHCAKLLFKVDVQKAAVETVCPNRQCRRYQVVRLVADVAPRLRHQLAPVQMRPEDLVALMETRWDAWVKDRARIRAEVAAGLRFSVFQRDSFSCRYCGRSVQDGMILHADHVIPKSKGGPTTLDNLVTACLDCNLGKSDKDIGDVFVLQ